MFNIKGITFNEVILCWQLKTTHIFLVILELLKHSWQNKAMTDINANCSLKDEQIKKNILTEVLYSIFFIQAMENLS